MKIKNGFKSYQLSPMQEGILFQFLKTPSSGEYVLQALVTVKETLDISSFKRAWEMVIERHDILRTRFEWEGIDEVIQIVEPQAKLPLNVFDWRRLASEKFWNRFEEFLVTDRFQDFAIDKAPVFRVSLFQTNDSEFKFLATFHHLVFDGSSGRLIFDEFFSLYHGLTENRKVKLPQPLQYGEYIEWSKLQDFSRHKKYWRKILKGFSEPTQLPRVKLISDETDRNIRRSESITIDDSLTYKLERFFREYLICQKKAGKQEKDSIDEGLGKIHSYEKGVRRNISKLSLNPILQGAWSLILYHYSGNQDVVFGITRACRTLSIKGALSVAGPFINTLPVRVRINGNVNSIELMKDLQQQNKELKKRENTPIVQIKKWSEVPRKLELFESLYVFDRGTYNDFFPAKGGRWLNLHIREYISSHFSIELFAFAGAKMILRLDYNPKRFEHWMAKNMLNGIPTILEAMLLQPHAKVVDLPYMSGAERQKLLVDWNPLQAACPADKTLVQLFEEQAARTPEAVAVEYGESRLTYRELNTRANQLAHYLQSKGVGSESRVGIWMQRSLELMVALIGTLKVGGAYVPLDPNYPQERLAFMLGDAQVAVLLTAAKFLGDIPEYAGEVVCMDRDWGAISTQSGESPASGITPDCAAYVIYTSGSTGVPKGVIGLHRGAVNRLSWMWRVYPFKGGEICCQKTYLSFVDSVWEIFGPLLKGVSTVIIPDDTVKDAHLLVERLAANHVSRIVLVPSLLRVLLDSFGDLQKRLPDLQLWVTSGEEIPLELAKRFREVMPQARLVNLYGSSEVSADVTCYEVGDDLQGQRVPIGRPIDNTQVYLLDAYLQPVPVGVHGELFVGGAGLARGYFNRPDLTVERFIPSPLQPGDVLFKTGDVGRYLPDGNIEYLGRRDHQVKIRGFRVELGEIESRIKEVEEVSSCVVVLREDRPGDQRLTAYYVPRGSQTVSVVEVRRQLQSKLPDYMVPQHFVELASIPLTPNGKVDRKALPKPETDGASEQGYVAPRTETEQKIAEIWKEVLQQGRVGVHDDFFELGGHSLMATQVMSRINRLFNVQLPLRRLFETRTVGGLAEHIASEIQEEEEIPISRISRDGALSVSFSQERLWFLSQLEPESRAYKISGVVRLEGQLQVGVLEQSLTEIVRRHETLRTSFEEIQGRPVQVISPEAAFELPQVDLQELSEADRQAKSQQIVIEEAQRPFDLSKGPLFRALLVQLGQQEHVLSVVMHHVITDGWSLGVFTRELEALYAAFLEGKPSPFPDLLIQYADYAAWQRERLQGQVLEGHLAYWKEKLGGELATLDLPTDRARPAVQTHRGAQHGFDLPKGLADKINSLSRQQGVTLFMTLLAAFKVLLYRYTGQTDFVVGSPIANRTRSELEGLIGFFVNTLALRTDISRDPGFVELLGRVRETTLGAYDHQELPFEKLVEVLNPVRDMSYSPLFQVMFVLQNMPGVAVQLPGVRLSPVGTDAEASMFDLTLYMWEGEKGLSGRVEYNTDLFDARTIERLAGQFCTLLESVVAEPTQRISELPMLTEAERRRVLVEWNATEETACPADKTLVQLFEEQAARTPEAVAVEYGESRLTYRELNTRANQLAHYLQSKGVGSESRVGIWMQRSLELMVALIGTLKVGGAYVPLDPNYPQERLAFMLGDAQVAVLLTAAKFLGDIPEYAGEVVCMDRDWGAISTQSGESPASGITPDCAAYVIYTSGSTGVPKGVIGLHRGAVNRLSWMWRVYPFKGGEICCQKTYLSFVDSVWEIFGPLLKGVSTVIIPDDTVKDAHLLVERLAANHVSRIVLVPSLLRVLLDSFGDLQKRLPDLQLWVTSGEEIPLELAKRFREVMPQARLVNLYGSSEVSADVTCYEVGDDLQGQRVPIGRPIDNTQVYLLDAYLQPVPVGVHGELFVGGAGLARGYFNRPDLTVERFIPSPLQPGDVLFKTGDVGRYLPDGNIEYLGRRDHQVKIRGFRVELGEIESRIKEVEEVSSCVVVLREDRPGDQRLTAYYVPRGSQTVSVVEVRRQLQSKLPDYMVPQHFVELASIPLTPNGKVDRKALPKPETDGASEQGYVAPRTETEQKIAEIWKEVLQQGRVGVHDDFFELGGHSLMATQVMSRINRLFNVQLPLRRLFETRTVGGLAEHIASEIQEEEEIPISRISRDGALSVSFSQERLWFLSQLEPESRAYKISGVVRLEGQLQVGVLEQSLTEIVRRHETLRTSFEEIQGRPVQVISPEAAFELPQVDLQELSEADRQAKSQQIVIEEAQRPFDLSKGPLFRALLVQLGQQEHVLSVVMHHVITDGWSLGVFTRELEALYAAFLEGKPSPFPDLLIQYADYAAWQRERLQGQVLEGHLAYWKEKLGGELATLDLPTDRARPAVQTHRGAQHGFDLPKGLADKINSLSRQQGVTLFMTLLAAFKVLLYRYTGQTDFVVGSPIANRTRSELEGLIGFFVNTLALRTDISRDPGFVELLGRVRETTLGAYDHQELPFEKLVEVLNPVRDMSYSPLFQVMFVLQNMPGVAVQLPGVRLSPVGTDAEASMFDLTLYMWEGEKGLSGRVEYNTDLFDARTIERLAGQFCTLLESVVAEPTQRISELPMLTEAERRRVLVEWNATEETACPADKTLVQLFEEQAARTPEAVAVEYGESRLTYRELNTRANQLAHYLQSKGVGSESRVGIWMQRSLELMVALIGTLKVGGAYVPLDPNYPQERLAFMLGDAQVAVLLTAAKFLGDIPEYAGEVVCMDRDWGAISTQSGESPASGITPDCAAYVIYTSGSTGVPKGVIGLHRGAVNRLSWMWRVYPFKGGEICCQKTYLSFVDSVWEIFGPLLKGVSTVIIPDDTVKDAHLLVERLAANHVSRIVLVPSLLRVLLDSFGDLQKRLPDLQLWVTSGEEIPLELAKRFREVMPQARLVNLYGSSEVSADVTCYEVGDDLQGQRVPIGRPIDNTQVYLLDAYLQPVPVGVHGELFVGGAGLARGYFNRPDLTVERFIPSPLQPGDVLFKTGDVGRYLPDGNIEYLGRRDHQVKIRGFRVELGEIESRIKEVEEVSSCVVVLREDRPGDQRLTAYYVPRGSQTVSVVEVRRQLQSKLPDYMVPQHFVELASIPLTPNGKVDRKALPKPETDGASEQGYVAPRTETEQKIAEIWKEVLQQGRVGVHDDFFELGGHSLMATQVMSRINRLFNVQLPLRRLFETRTVGGLAEHIASEIQEEEEIPISRISRDGALSVSFSQERLWFLSQLEPESRAYKISGVVRLEGQLQVGVLEQSLTEIVRRHETLRTSFEEIQGRPVQVISPEAAFELPQVDLQELSEADRQAKSQQIVIEEAQRPFDLSKGPLFRALLVQLGQQEHVLSVVMHHVITDGWSLGVFTRELEALYAAFLEGKPSPFPDLLIQYADYAAWQRERLQGQVLEGHLAYWKEKLGGELATLDLPTDRARPAVQTHRGAQHGFDLPKGLADKINSLSRQQGVTLFMTLLAAFKVLLYRYTGQTDFVVGSPIANRTRSELEGLIGFFVNTLALRTDISRDPGFVELLGRVRETTLGAYDHQELPFEKLVEVLNPVRDMSYSPLFQVMFVLQNMPGVAVQLPGVRLSPVGTDAEASMFDLTLYMWEGEKGLSGRVEYNTDLFDARTIERLAGQFCTLLESVVAEPTQRISELPMLTEAERRRVLVEWNATEETACPADKTLVQLFEEQAARTPEAVAVEYGESRLTYRELNTRANQLAHYLQSKGVGSESRVGIWMQRSLELMVALIGTLKVGGAYVPLDPNYPQERLAFMLGDAQVAVLLTAAKFLGDIPEYAGEVVCMDRDWGAISTQSGESPASGITPDCAAYVIYTSGSTGVPKGVIGLHRGAVNRLSWMWRVYPFKGGEICCQKTYLSFVDSVWEIFGPLLKGVSTVIIPDDTVKDAHLLVERLAANHVSRIVLVPSLLRVLLDSFGDLQKRLPDLQLWVTSGEEIPLELAKRFREVMPQARLVNLYGSSEVSADVTCYEVGDDLQGQRVPIGRPIDNTQVYLLDAYLQPVPVGVHGELFVGGAGLARGYFNRPDLTVERFIPSPLQPGDVLFKTGDVGRYLPDGNIEYLGRRDHQVKIRGFRVELGEIESRIKEVEEVSSCVVVLREDRPGDQRLTAYYVPRGSQTVSVVEVRRQLQSKLPDYMVPQHFVELASIPLTPNGKVDRKALPKPETDGASEQGYVAPRTETEQKIAEIWKEVLQQGRVGVHDDFFELGGHSLLAVNLFSQIRKIFDVDLPLAILFQNPTVAKLSNKINAELYYSIRDTRGGSLMEDRLEIEL